MTTKLLKALLATALIAAAAIPQAAHAEGGPVRHYPQLAKPAGQMRLRAGPGSMFPQIDLIPRGEALIVSTCVKGWCQIRQQDGGPSGWMSDAYLIFLGEIHG